MNIFKESIFHKLMLISKGLKYEIRISKSKNKYKNKSEIRISKSETNTKFKTFCFAHLYFEHLRLFRISDFVLRIFIRFVSCFVFCASNAEAVCNLSLQEAVRIGLSNSRELKVANLELASTKAAFKKTLSQVYPQITGNINSSYNSLEKMGLSFPPIEGYSNNISLSLNQPLFTGGKLSNAIKYANEQIKLALLKTEQEENELIYKIVTSYWNTKKAIELKKVCKKRVEYANSIMEIASFKYKEGLIPEVEVMKQEVNLASAKEELIKARCREKLAKDNLKDLLKMEGEIEIIDEPVFVPLRITEKEIIREAMANNPEIRRMEAEIKQKELQIKINRADYIPNVYLRGVYNLSGKDRKSFKGSIEDISRDFWQIGIMIEIPIFNGFYTASKLKEAKLNYKIAEENLNILKEKITLEIKKILDSLLEAEERVGVSLKSKKLVSEILRITKARYELGLISSAQVKEAEEAFVRSSTMYIEAIIDYELCRMNLLRIMGKIKDILLKGE